MDWPKELFIKEKNEEKEVFNYLAWKDIENVDDGTVAVYELKKLVNKKTEIVIEEL